MMNKYTFPGVVAVTIGVLVVASLTAGARTEVQSLDPIDLVPEFGEKQTSLDSAPAVLAPLIADARLDESSIRLIAESTFGRHWIALDGDTNICVVTLTAVDNVAGANCMPRDAFHLIGATILVSGPSEYAVVTHLLPDGVTEAEIVKKIEELERQSDEFGVESESVIEVFGDGRLVVMDSGTARKLGNLEFARDNAPALVLYDMSY